MKIITQENKIIKYKLNKKEKDFFKDKKFKNLHNVIYLVLCEKAEIVDRDEYLINRLKIGL